MAESKKNEKLTHESLIQCPFCNRAIIVQDWRKTVEESRPAVYQDRVEAKKDPQQMLPLHDEEASE